MYTIRLLFSLSKLAPLSHICSYQLTKGHNYTTTSNSIPPPPHLGIDKLGEESNEYLYRTRSSLATNDSAPPPSLPPPLRQQVVSLSQSSCDVCRRSNLRAGKTGGRGWERCNSIRRGKSLVLHKSFNTLLLGASWMTTKVVSSNYPLPCFLSCYIWFPVL